MRTNYKAKTKILTKGFLILLLLMILILQSIAFAEPNVSVTMADWVYGDTPSEPRPMSSTHGTNNVTFAYKKQGTSSYTSVKPTDVGSYTVRATFAAINDYPEESAEADFNITKKTLYITANAQTREYGDPNPTLTFTYRNNVTGEVPAFTGTLATVANSTTDVGTYEITRGNLALADNPEGHFLANNYSYTAADYTSANLVITKKTIAVPVAREDLIYNGANQIGVPAGTGYTITGNTQKDAGNYTAVATLGSNYQWNNGEDTTTTRNINWTIAKKVLTITATNKTKIFGEENPEFTYSASGLAATDNITKEGSFACSATATSPVGDYDITQGTFAFTGNTNKNYTINFVKGTLTVTRRPIAVPNPIANLVYNGSVLTGVATNPNYDIVGNTATNAGNYIATLTPKENYQWNQAENTTSPININWSIAKFNINGTTVTFSEDNITYTGSEITPTATVKQGSVTLVEGVDYTIEYSNNINPGSAVVKLTAMGVNYSGTKTVNFTITRKTAVLPSGTNFTYDGVQKQGVPDGEGYTLTENKIGTDAGTRSVTATLKTGYKWNTDNSTSQKTITWTINQAPLVGRPPRNASKLFGESDPPIYPVITGLQNGEKNGNSGTLRRDPGEAASYYRITGNGTYQIADNPDGHFKKANYTYTYDGTGEAAYFRIIELSIESCKVTLNPNKLTYNGEAQTVTVSLSLNGNALVQDRDYTVRYANNKDAGHATIYIEGKGNYVGNKQVSLEIQKYNIKTYDNKMQVTLTPNTFVYDGTAKIPNVSVVWKRDNTHSYNLIEDVDYTISYSNNVNPGNNTGVATITGIGNYTGTIARYYSITKKALSGIVTLSQDVYEYNGTERRPTVQSVVLEDGTPLVANRDYDITYADNINAGRGKVIITAKGNFQGTMIKEFEITKVTPVLTIQDKVSTYNGYPLTINEPEVSKVYNYKNKGTAQLETVLSDMRYKYYKDSTLSTLITGAPIDAGIYYVIAVLPEESYSEGGVTYKNHNEAISNTAKLTIVGKPNAPIIEVNDGVNILPDGCTTGEGVNIKIFGSEALYGKDAWVGYKYWIDGVGPITYTEIITDTNPGTRTITAVAFLQDNPAVQSDETSFTYTIDKTKPSLSDVTVPEVADSVVIDVSVAGNEIKDIFITEDPNYRPDRTDDWQYLGADGEAERGKTIFEMSQGDGIKTLYIWQRDKAGNIADYPSVKEVALKALKVGNHNENETSFYFKILDKYLHTSQINNEKIKLIVNGFDVNGNITNIEETAIENGFEYKVTMKNIETDGEFSFTVDKSIIYDKAGNNISDTNSLVNTNEITIDNTLPIMSVAVSEREAIVNVLDEHFKALTHNGKIVSRINGRFKFDLVDGKNIITAIDEYGNDVSEEITYKKTTIYENSVPNPPELLPGMTAAYLNNNEWQETDYFNTSMYNYANQEWANAFTEDGSMWVWIPRYAYKVVNGIYQVIFLKGKSNEYIDYNGNLLPLPDGYTVAEGFTKEPGAEYGTNYELTGFWIAKYEMSKETSTNGYSWSPATDGADELTTKAGNSSANIRVVTKANRTPWNNISVSKAFSNSLSMYTSARSHLMKNSEFEAAIILGLTEYGAGSIGYDTTITTGTDVNTSTTKNVTGVFDMLGGSFEYTSTYINGLESNTNTSALVDNIDTGIKEVISAGDISTKIHLVDKESSIFGTVPYATSKVVYRSGHVDSTAGNPGAAPVGGTANSKVGYRVVLFNDKTNTEGPGEDNTTNITYTLTFSPNGGDGTDSTVYARKTDSYTLPGSSYFTRLGYRIVGWSTNSGTLPSTPYGNTYFAPGSSIALTSDLTLYAIWDVMQYTVVFNGNGSTQGVMSNQVFTYNEAQNLSDNSFEKQGYSFYKWNTSPDGTGASYDDGESVTNITGTSSITLYAIWNPNTYTVIFDTNGNNVFGTMPNQDMIYDSSNQLAMNNYTRNGYSFDGWNTRADGSGTSYTDGQVVTNLVSSGNITLYAKWIGNTYNVEFNGNGSTSGTMTPQTLTYDVEENLKINTYEKTGYTFETWNTLQNGLGHNYTDGQSVKNIETSGTIILYAQWGANTYNVLFNNNGGQGDMPSQEFTYDTPNSLAKNIFTKTGYNFAGWTLNAENTGTVYSDEEVVTNLATAGNITLYAKWEPKQYRVEFNANSGVGTMADQTLTYDVLTALSENTFTKEGHAFVEWNTRSDGTGVSYEDKQQVSTLTTDDVIILYAQWKQNEYEIVFNNNTGSGSMDNLPASYDTSIVLSLNTFTKTGYSFVKWNTRADGTGVDYIDGQVVLNLCQNDGDSITLYAQWTPNKYTVTFHGNGSTSGVMDIFEIYYDETRNLPLNQFLREGSSFLGWNTKPDGTGTPYTNGQSINNILTTGNLDLYARWSVNSYTVKYDKNDDDATGTMNDQIVDFGVTFNLSPNAFEKEGYSFDKWNTLADGSGTSYQDEQSVSNLVTVANGVITLYARWKADTAKYIPGPDLNNALIGLAGSAENITNIHMENIKPLDSILENAVDVSSVGLPIYAWYEDGAIKIWTEATTVLFDNDLSDLLKGLSGLTKLGTGATNDLVAAFGTTGTNSVTDMSGLFDGCSSLESIDLSTINTANVTDMNRMFADMTSIIELHIETLKTNNVTNMNEMFEGDSSLVYIYISDQFSKESLTTSTNMFDGCTSIQGGSGTTYDPSHKDATYAKLDGGEENPGYFFNLTLFVITYDVNGGSREQVPASEIKTGSQDYYITDKEPSLANHVFKGWSLSSTATDATYAPSELFDKNRSVTLYAVWKADTAIIVSSQSFNKALKSLIDNSAEYYTSDTTIKVIVWSDDAPSIDLNQAVSAKNDINSITPETTLIDISDNSVPIYAWLDGDTIKIWSNANEVELNQNASNQFYRFEGVTTIDLGPITSKNTTNMKEMFYDCKELVNFDASCLDTSKVTTMESMFNNCSKLASLDLSTWDTSKVTNMASMFYNMKLLENLDISQFNTGNVTTMSAMFFFCMNLTSIDLSHFDTSKVTDMSRLFTSSENLESITISSINTSNVIDMHNMFSGCKKITTLDISGFDTSKVTNMCAMFGECKQLNNIVGIEGINVSKVQDMGGMFFECDALTSLDLSSWNVGQVTTFNGGYSISSSTISSHDAGMFEACDLLQELDLTGWNTQNATSMEFMFGRDPHLEKIYASPDFVTSGVTAGENMFFDSTRINGGNGTTYSGDHLDKEYAWIDGREGLPGYFWCKDTYTIAFDGNTAEMGTMEDIPMQYGDVINLPANEFTKTNHIFKGWNTKADGSGTHYNDEQEVKNIYTTNEERVILYAEWQQAYAKYVDGELFNVALKVLAGNDGSEQEDVEDIVITFSSNHGHVVIYNQTITPSDVAIVDGPDDWTREGYDFVGWSLIPDGDVQFVDGDLLLPRESCVLYAVWQRWEAEASFVPSNSSNDDLNTPGTFRYVISHLPGVVMGQYPDSNKYPTFENITKFEWSSVEPDDSNKQEENIISTPNSTYPIYAWFDNGTIKLWSQARATKLGNNCIDMFCRFVNLTSIDLYHDMKVIDADNVSSCQSMFKQCSNLVTANLEELIPYQATNLQQFFEKDFKLENVNLSNFHTPNITNCFSFFTECKALKTVDLSCMDTRKVTKMENMFNECRNLETIYVSELFDVSKVTSSNNMFKNCTKLVGGNGTTFDSSKTNKEYARIDTEDQPGYFTEKISSGVRATTNKLNNAKLAYNNRTNIVSRDGTRSIRTEVIHSSIDRYITGIKWSSIAPSAELIANSANVVDNEVILGDCANVSQDGLPIYAWFDNGTIWLYSEAETIELSENSSYMFEKMSVLSDFGSGNYDPLVALNVSDTSNLENMCGMFKGCTNLPSIDVSSFNTSNVTNMSRLFEKCRSITELHLETLNTSKVVNTSSMFEGARSLVHIFVEDLFRTARVESSVNMFFGDFAIEGGSGTTYDPEHIDVERAILDAGEEVPGYFYNVVTFTIQLNPNGGNLNGLPSYLEKIGAQTLVLPNGEPTKEGEFFSGWAYESDAATPDYLKGSDFNRCRDMILYAVWGEKSYQIVFDGNGATSGDMQPQVLQYSALEPLSQNAFIREGFEFNGWNTEADGTGESYVDEEVVSRLTEENGATITLYAQWNENHYHISFDANGGEGSMESFTNIAYSEEVEMPTCGFTRDDYAFVKWNTDSNGSGDDYIAGETYSKLVEEDGETIMLYAIWRPDWAQYLSGQLFNQAIKELAGNSNPTYSTQDNYITGFEWQTGISIDDVPQGVINVSCDGAPIYAWFEDNGDGANNIKLFSEASTIKMNDDASYMFSGLNSIAELDVLNDLGIMTTENVVNMSNMFANASNLESIDFSDIDTSNVTDMSGMFSNCSSLIQIDLSDFETDNVTTMKDMFSGCSSLMSIDLSTLHTGNVTSMENMMLNCTSLTSVNVSGISLASCADCRAIFKGCEGITTLDLSTWNTDSISKFDNMFNGCSALEKIYASSLFALNDDATSTNMFLGCISLNGGNGTTYADAGVTDGEYAHIDGFGGLPGYFWCHSTFTITYFANANGDPSLQGVPSGDVVDYGTSYTVSTLIPTRESFIFKGWAYSNISLDVQVRPGESIKPLADTSLYAVWCSLFEISLDNQGAQSAGTEKIYEQYNDGYYLDDSLEILMTSGDNPITIPQKTYIVSYEGDFGLVDISNFTIQSTDESDSTGDYYKIVGNSQGNTIYYSISNATTFEEVAVGKSAITSDTSFLIPTANLENHDKVFVWLEDQNGSMASNVYMFEVE